MLIKDIKYCYDDIAVKPAVISHIRHRSECYPFRLMPIGYDDEPTLPIFTAPMSTVVNEKNFKLFEKNNIIPILPRNIPPCCRWLRLLSICRRYLALTGKSVESKTIP